MLLTLSWRRSLSYRNQCIDLQSKSVDWLLYDRYLRHERLKSENSNNNGYFLILVFKFEIRYGEGVFFIGNGFQKMKKISSNLTTEIYGKVFVHSCFWQFFFSTKIRQSLTKHHQFYARTFSGLKTGCIFNLALPATDRLKKAVLDENPLLGLVVKISTKIKRFLKFIHLFIIVRTLPLFKGGRGGGGGVNFN